MAPGYDAAAYAERLAFELDVITGMNYQGYFLIVADFIKWAKAEGIPVGPGRGSGAGSLVAYALTITDLDPIRFGLLFERFLNPERVSMPDFDIDFCQDRRDEVIAYVRERYGADRVAHIITFGKLQARAVLRDVGRVLQMPYGQVDRLCKLVPDNPANPVTLPQAIAAEPRLQEARDDEPIVAKLLDIGQRLEGLYRHASTHAAGVVIADRPLIELVPLYRDARAQLPATQFNMKWAEAAGLVKFDFLGLKTLTVIETARELIARRGIEIDPGQTPSRRSGDLRAPPAGRHGRRVPARRSGHARCAAQAEARPLRGHHRHRRALSPGSDGQHRLLRQPQARPRGIETLHPMIEPILKETYGVIIYQEQVMQIAQVLSGFSLGEADLLRRAMGKKIKKEMAAQKSRFVEGAVANGVDRGARRIYFRAGGEIRGLRLQQIPRRGLCADRLSDRLSQGQLPDRVHRGVDDAGHGQHRQAERLRAGSAPHGHAHRAAFGQPLGGRLHSERRRHPLFARGAEECRPARGRASLRRARGERTVPRRFRFRAAHQSASRQQARAGDACRRRRSR